MACRSRRGGRASWPSVRERELALQFGGAVGTLASLGDRGLDVAVELGDQLGLAGARRAVAHDPLRPARIACALGVTLGVMGKIGRDVVLLAQTEVAEVARGRRRGSRGGSSTHAAQAQPGRRGGSGRVRSARSGSGRDDARGDESRSTSAARGRGRPNGRRLPALLRLTGSAAALARELLSGLEVDAEKMRTDMELTGGLVMSESVAAALALGARPGRRAGVWSRRRRGGRWSPDGRFARCCSRCPRCGRSRHGRARRGARPRGLSRRGGRADRPSAGGAPCRLS